MSLRVSPPNSEIEGPLYNSVNSIVHTERMQYDNQPLIAQV